ncbi:MAG: UDP binding domain-containing protein, partial [Oscillospiraceae bacterium]
EFLRESKALYDNLYPSRIIVGTDMEDKKLVKAAHTFARLLQECALKEDIDTLFMDFSQAEAVKLFSNAYLAMRISYFNELDTYCELKGIEAKDIIHGVCLEPRIGDFYNNPSFGYGGYCLPKDTKQLLSDYEGVPQSLMGAVVQSNEIRKDFMVKRILQKIGYDETAVADSANFKKAVVGVYGPAMKTKGEIFRNSPVEEIIKSLKAKGVKVIIYEPKLKNGERFCESEVVNDFKKFKSLCSLIIANRYDDCLEELREKVYTRDLFQRD